MQNIDGNRFASINPPRARLHLSRSIAMTVPLITRQKYKPKVTQPKKLCGFYLYFEHKYFLLIHAFSYHRKSGLNPSRA